VFQFRATNGPGELSGFLRADRLVVGAVLMPFETTLSVPTRHVGELMSRLAGAGFLILDTGERLATDDGPDAEATLRLLHVAPHEAELAPLGVSR